MVRPDFHNRFSSAINLARDRNVVYEGGILSLLHFFMKRLAIAELNLFIWPRFKSCKHQKEGTVKSYCKSLHHLQETYETNNVIAQIGTDMMHFSQLSNKSTTEYAEAVKKKVLRCGMVYDEFVLKRIFIGGLSETVQHSMRP